MTRFSTPPDPDLTILPAVGRRIAFFGLGQIAAILRMLTAPGRAAVARKRRNAGVLIYEPFGMGDVIALQPLVRAWLNAGHPVTLAAKAAWSEIIPPHPAFSFVPVSPAYASACARGKNRQLIGDCRAIGAALRPHGGGAIGIDVRGDVRGIIMLYLAGCASVRTLPRYYTANDCRVPTLAAHRVPLLRGVSRRNVNGSFSPPGTPLENATLDHLLPRTASPPDEYRIGLIPLTPWAGKQWMPERWRQVILRLREKGFHPVVLCGPGETEAARIAVGGHALEAPCCESTSVRDWVGRLAACGGVIAVNTGPMHVANALNRPLVVLDGPSRLPLWAPEGDRAFVVHHQEAVDCAPCHPVGDCVACGHRCMRLITPDDVIDALDQVLNVAGTLVKCNNQQQTRDHCFQDAGRRYPEASPPPAHPECGC